jgi:hypothetical protein
MSNNAEIGGELRRRTLLSPPQQHVCLRYDLPFLFPLSINPKMVEI